MLMGVPPPITPSGGSYGQTSGPGDSNRGKRKPFRLPQKDTGEENQNPDRDNIFELSKQQSKKTKEIKEEIEAASAAVDQHLQAQEDAQAEAASGAQEIGNVEAKNNIAKVSELIMKMVDQFQVGAIGGKDFASLHLKSSSQVPDFLENTTLTLTQTSEGVIIRFSNFQDPQQEAAALLAIQSNKQQLAQLSLNLSQKNLTIADLQVGNHSINVREITQLEPPPFFAQSEKQQDREQGQGQRQDQGEPEDEES